MRDVSEPTFDISLDDKMLGKVHTLALDTVHGGGHFLSIHVELKLLYALRALLKVRLHSRHFLGLRKNFKQFVIGKEIKTRKARVLGLEIV